MNQCSDAALIASILQCGSLEAESLLRHVGGLSGLNRQIHLARLPQIAAALELASRILVSEMKHGSKMSDPKQAGNLARSMLRTEEREVFLAIFMDSQNRVIEAEKLFFGTINGSEVHPREVVRRAMHHNCASIVAAHNHPSGSIEPSPADRVLTKHLRDALDLIDVRLLDHIIVGGDSTFSFAEHGMI